MNRNRRKFDQPRAFSEADSFEFPATVPLSSETHGGDDVGVFAVGPHSHLFTGVIQQNLIPHMMAYASCLGEYAGEGLCYRAVSMKKGRGGLRD